MAMPWNIIGSVLDKIIPDKSQRDQAKLSMMELQQAGEFAPEERRYEVINMEAQSQHKFVALARPSFLYVMYAFMVFAIPFGFLAAFQPVIAVNVTNGMQAWLAAIPQEMWVLFGVGYLGYVKKRSDDKETMLNPEKEKSFLQKIF